MKALAVVLLLVIGSVGRPPPMLCVGALHAIVSASAKQEAPAVPEDWVCSRAGWMKGGRRTTDAPCRCHAVADAATSCEERIEDKACNRFCRADKCSCPAAECK